MYSQYQLILTSYTKHGMTIQMQCKITYTMIGDPSQTITRNFDVLDEATGLAQRGTFIIDDGVVQASEINADGGRDASTLAHKIKAAQYVRKTLAKYAQLNGKKALNIATWFRFSR